MVCSFFSLVFFASHSISSVSKLCQTGTAVVYSACFTSPSIITPPKIHIHTSSAAVQQAAVPHEPITPSFINCSPYNLGLCVFKKCSIWFTTIPSIHYSKTVNCVLCYNLQPKPNNENFPPSAAVWNVLPCHISFTKSTLNVFIMIINIQWFAKHFKITHSNRSVNLNVMNLVQNHSFLSEWSVHCCFGCTQFLPSISGFNVLQNLFTFKFSSIWKLDNYSLHRKAFIINTINQHKIHKQVWKMIQKPPELKPLVSKPPAIYEETDQVPLRHNGWNKF